MASRLADLLVRPVAPSDHDFVIQLAARVFGTYSWDPVATSLYMLDEPGAEAAVAERRGEPVGFVIMRFDRYPRDYGPLTRPIVVRVNAIAVKPELFGRGIGRKLLAHVEATARGRGAVAISLMTARSNVRARTLFSSAGFTALAPLGRYARGQGAVSMIKAILPGC